jgi:hypothetical protein
MCERCALAWHATMTAMLLESILVSKQLSGDVAMIATTTAAATNTKRCGKCGREFDRKAARVMHERHCKGQAHKVGTQ